MSIDKSKLDQELDSIIKDVGATVQSAKERCDIMRSNLEAIPYLPFLASTLGPPGTILYERIDPQRIADIAKAMTNATPDCSNSEFALAAYHLIAACAMNSMEEIGVREFATIMEAHGIEMMLRKMHDTITRKGKETS